MTYYQPYKARQSSTIVSSAYRKHHSVQTSMLKMYHDLIDSIDNSQVTIVVIIDLSAAFDTIDVSTLLKLLQTDFDIQGIPLKWV